ncbi:Abieta-7,13-dien-18-ol hydroxylase protein [Dioscorea alata]|uniref:Abieta-7,13-dien-18-ol hydroxylase protein n=1 Tax=Dioscorea alata TaxID=55571 RepID=A0ACB7UVA4_DIOAL|nr:Abieta-7,13-dien-18-ol hydroxylase protein [Dioscorea alata]
MDFFAEPQPISVAILIALLLLPTFYAFKLILWPSFAKKWRRRNYPPVAGTIFHQFMNLNRLQDFQTDISHKYKTFRMLTPSCNFVYTVDPVNVEYILKTNFANYGKGKAFHDVTKDLLGDGIFAVDGEKWRQQRKIASYEFSARVLRDYSSAVFRDTAVKLVEIILAAVNSEQMIDIQDLLMKSTLDSIFKVGFGVELDTLSGSNMEGKNFAKAFDDSSKTILKRFFDVSWKIKRFLNVGEEAIMKKNIKYIDDFVYMLIKKKMEQSANYKDDVMIKEDILSRFLMERKKDPSTMSDQYLRDIILNFVIAGRDTTAGTLSWFFYMLCKHPDVQEKVAQEIRETTSTKDETPFCEFSVALTEETLNNMQYLHAALSETLRLYPAVPLDVKECSSDDTLPDGFAVKKGDFVNYQPYAMGRMKFLWGDDAEDFRPERWFNDEGVFQPQNPFKFTAFQAGPRICLGKDFAYRQMKIFAAILLCFFRFKLWDENKSVNYRTMLTLQIDGGLQLCAMHR